MFGRQISKVQVELESLYVNDSNEVVEYIKKTLQQCVPREREYVYNRKVDNLPSLDIKTRFERRRNDDEYGGEVNLLIKGLTEKEYLVLFNIPIFKFIEVKIDFV